MKIRGKKGGASQSKNSGNERREQKPKLQLSKVPAFLHYKFVTEQLGLGQGFEEMLVQAGLKKKTCTKGWVDQKTSWEKTKEQRVPKGRKNDDGREKT